MQLPSKLQIDDQVSFFPMEKDCQEMQIAKDEMCGTITAVRFTKAKVWYEILDDYHAKIFTVTSNNAWIPNKENLPQVKPEKVFTA